MGVEYEVPPIAEIDIEDASRSIARKLIQRWDLHARQLKDGRYICIRKPLTVGMIAAHLRGDITLGTYLLDRHSQTRFMVLDCDQPRGLKKLLHIAQSLAVERIPSHLERSRRGGHLWLFFAAPIPGKQAREFGRGLLGVHHMRGVDIYPRQDELRTGPGSLVRLPFGIHQRTGERYCFIGINGKPIHSSMVSQIRLVCSNPTIPVRCLSEYANYSK